MTTLQISDSSEDHLPADQPTIQTLGVKRLNAFMTLATAASRYPLMGVITGRAGLGKTSAVQDFVDQAKPESYTGLPSIIKVKVVPDSTPKALALDILTSLGEKASGGNRYQLADEAAAAIVRNLVRLLIVDEADRLTDASFDLLRHIHDKTGCPVVLVGLPDILKVIARQEKFESRVGLKMQFPAVTREEMLEVVLPGMIFPHWKINVEDPNDCAMGERIYELVGGSMRKLRNLLNIANQIVEIDQGICITPETIEEAFRWTPFEHRGVDEHNEDDGNEEKGVHERVSELRHAGKAKGRRKST